MSGGAWARGGVEARTEMLLDQYPMRSRSDVVRDVETESGMRLAAALRYARMNNIPVRTAWRYIAGHFPNAVEPDWTTIGQGHAARTTPSG